MPSIRISKELNQRTYFLTFTIKNWYYILDRYGRWNILAECLKWYQKNKKLKIYGFIFMINHVHLMIKSDDVIDFVKGFKSFTAREVFKNIKNTEPNVLKIFYDKKKEKYELWSKTNMPKGIETEKYFHQKIEYIHNNPVKRVYVSKAEDWYWSSANNNCEIKIDNVYEK
jgi:REP-associated tyrosine transposase